MRADALALLAAVLLAGCAGPPPAAPGDDPEAALRALETRLATADYAAFRATVSRLAPMEDWYTALQAHVRLGPDGRARVESEGEVNGLGAAPGFVSDGRRVLGGRGGFVGPSADFDGPAAPALREWLAAAFVRRGLAYPLFRSVAGIPPDHVAEAGEDTGAVGDAEARLVPTGFAWGVPEVIDGRTTRPLSFSLPLDGASGAAVTLWLDTETGLPVRRAQRVVYDDGPYVTDEAYADWSFDALPDSLFTLPH